MDLCSVHSVGLRFAATLCKAAATRQSHAAVAQAAWTLLGSAASQAQPTPVVLQAKLRREAVAARKEASAVRLELAKVLRSSGHRAQEASCLKAALKGRDVLLEEMQGRVKQLEDELAR